MLGLEESMVSKTDMIFAPEELKSCGRHTDQSVGRSIRGMNLMGLQEARRASLRGKKKLEHSLDRRSREKWGDE